MHLSRSWVRASLVHRLAVLELRDCSTQGARQRQWLKLKFLCRSPKLFGGVGGVKGALLASTVSNPVPMPPACPCSERACLKHWMLDCVSYCDPAHGPKGSAERPRRDLADRRAHALRRSTCKFLVWLEAFRVGGLSAHGAAREAAPLWLPFGLRSTPEAQT